MSALPAERDQEPPCRYVAIGEGFTEGVGDPDRRLPNGVRGWADRVAEGLAAAAPGWQYANLAVRGRRMTSIWAEQLPAALELQPMLVSLTVGARDVLVSSTEQVPLLDRYETAVSALAGTGATVLLFTHPGRSATDSIDERTFQHNDFVRRLAREHGAVLIDPWDTAAFTARRVWKADKMHLSAIGHARLARHLLDVLGVAPDDAAARRSADRPGNGLHVGWTRQFRDWFVSSAAPAPGSSDPSAADRVARWPVPVEVPARGGLRSLMRVMDTNAGAEKVAAVPTRPSRPDDAPVTFT